MVLQVKLSFIFSCPIHFLFLFLPNPKGLKPKGTKPQTFVLKGVVITGLRYRIFLLSKPRFNLPFPLFIRKVEEKVEKYKNIIGFKKDDFKRISKKYLNKAHRTT